MENNNKKIEELVNIIRTHFTGINKALNEIRNNFVFKEFEEEFPTIKQDGDGYAIYLLDEDGNELPIEYASVIMDKIGCITPMCFNQTFCSKIMRGEYNRKDTLEFQRIFKDVEYQK